jgi:anti-sigma factor RsiW
MTTNDIHLLTGAFVLDSLDDTDRVVFTQHLGECEGCAGEVAELRETVVRLAEDAWAVPPPRLRQNVMDQIRATRQLPPEAVADPAEPMAPLRTPRPAWYRRAAYGLAAALLAVVAGGATYLVQEHRIVDQQRIDAVLSAPDVAVKVGQATGGGQVTVFTSPARNAAVVYLAGAPSPGTDRAYEFWMIEGGTPRPAGLLEAGSGRTYIAGLGGTDTLGMTNEKSSGATAPTPPILVAVPMK